MKRQVASVSLLTPLSKRLGKSVKYFSISLQRGADSSRASPSKGLTFVFTKDIFFAFPCRTTSGTNNHREFDPKIDAPIDQGNRNRLAGKERTIQIRPFEYGFKAPESPTYAATQ
jgi:hypothetical protein